jgi:TPR repeat protein
MYEEGKGTKKNLVIALDYYRQAADNDNVDAKYRLGCMHLIGYSARQDIVKAFYLFTDAANMGHLKSREALMLLDVTETNSRRKRSNKDEDIQYTEEDQTRMLETIAEKTPKRDLVVTQYQLGKMYQNKGDPKALMWLTLAARGSISDAFYRLGVFYEEGTFTQHNYEVAKELYETALKGDHEDAIYRLAKLYQFGRRTPIDYVKAYELYLLASKMRHLLSFKTLNIIGVYDRYSNNSTQVGTFDTTSQEYQQSLFMCEHVAEQENTELQYKIDTVYEDHLKEPDYSNALKWYQLAASNSHREAIYRLGLLYEKGLGVD